MYKTMGKLCFNVYIYMFIPPSHVNKLYIAAKAEVKAIDLSFLYAETALLLFSCHCSSLFRFVEDSCP